jgi:hypothetical protein
MDATASFPPEPSPPPVAEINLNLRSVSCRLL